jgi:hypothetical protein
MDDSEIFNSLQAQQPIIVGIRQPEVGIGHACLLTGATYFLLSGRSLCFKSFILWDPSPFVESRREMPAVKLKSDIGFAVWFRAFTLW